MTDPQSGRSGAMDPGRSDGAAGAVQSSLDEDRREHTQEDPQSGTDAAAGPGDARLGTRLEAQDDRNPEKDPDTWVTGDEPATGPQESYLSTLAQQAGEEPKQGLSKADASKEIERLQAETGRG